MTKDSSMLKGISLLLLGQRPDINVIIAFLLQMFAYFLLYSFSAEHKKDCIPYISALADDPPVGPWFEFLMFLSILLSLCPMAERFYQLERYSINENINFIALLLGLITLFTINTALVFPHDEMPKYHLFFSVTFFITATLYFFLNALFSLEISRIKEYENSYKYIAIYRVVLIALIFLLSVIHVCASAYMQIISKQNQSCRNKEKMWTAYQVAAITEWIHAILFSFSFLGFYFEIDNLEQINRL